MYNQFGTHCITIIIEGVIIQNRLPQRYTLIKNSIKRLETVDRFNFTISAVDHEIAAEVQLLTNRFRLTGKRGPW